MQTACVRVAGTHNPHRAQPTVADINYTAADMLICVICYKVVHPFRASDDVGTILAILQLLAL